jgi:hypothetical protein
MKKKIKYSKPELLDLALPIGSGECSTGSGNTVGDCTGGIGNDNDCKNGTFAGSGECDSGTSPAY